jgi:hypothetical protein
MLQPVFSFQGVSVVSDKVTGSDGDVYYRATNSNLGFAANGGLEIALGAAVNIGFGAGYQFFGTSKDWDIGSKTGSNGSWSKLTTITNDVGLNYTGLSAHVYLTWSVPGLPFDPIDLMRASAGL